MVCLEIKVILNHKPDGLKFSFATVLQFRNVNGIK